MQNFHPYVVRKRFGGTEFNFLIADEVGKDWYDSDNGRKIGPHSAENTPFKASRDGDITWPEMEILRDHIAVPGAQIVECGSHHGLTTVLLSAWIGETGFVHTFDAVHENITAVKRTLDMNGITNVSALCAAIGGKFSIMRMHNASNVTITDSPAPSPASTIMVKISSLFDTPPDAIKIDVEGAELGIIEADRDFIAKIPRLAIEVHTDMLPPDGVKRIIHALGERPLHILWGEKELRPYAGEEITERVHIFAWP